MEQKSKQDWKDTRNILLYDTWQRHIIHHCFLSTLVQSVFCDAVYSDFRVEVKVPHDACVERCISSILSQYRQLLWLVARQPHLCTKTEPSWGGLVCQSARPSGGMTVNVWVSVEGLLSLLYVQAKTLTDPCRFIWPSSKQWLLKSFNLHHPLDFYLFERKRCLHVQNLSPFIVCQAKIVVHQQATWF